MDLIRRTGSLDISSEPCRAGFVWLGWNAIGSLLPLWGTAFLLWIFGKDITAYNLLKNGEFVLYSAAFAGSAMYSIRRDLFPSKNTLQLLLVMSMLVSLLVFVAITVQSVNDKPEWFRISESAITTVSYLVLIATSLLCFLVTVAEADGAGKDVPEALKRDEKMLNMQFDKLLQMKNR